MVRLFSRANVSSRKLVLASALAAGNNLANRSAATSAQIAAPESGNYGLTAMSKRFFWNFVAAKLPIPGLDFLITYPQMKELQKEARLADAGKQLLIRSAVNAGRPVSMPLERSRQPSSVAVSRPEMRGVVDRHLQRRELLSAISRRKIDFRIMRRPLERRAIARGFKVRLPVRSQVELPQRPVKFRSNSRSV